jgi:hypothetical protein
MRTIILLLFLIPASICSGQTNAVTIVLNNGTSSTYQLSGIKEIVFSGITGDIKQEQFARDIIKNFTLYQNYPNPFNPSTTIKYEIPNPGVEVHIYDIRGSQIRSLAILFQQAGLHSIVWNGKNDSGVKVSSGTYFCRVKFNNTILINKLLLIK